MYVRACVFSRRQSMQNSESDFTSNKVTITAYWQTTCVFVSDLEKLCEDCQREYNRDVFSDRICDTKGSGYVIVRVDPHWRDVRARTEARCDHF